MENFFAKYPETGAGTNARMEAIENVKNKIKWLEQNKNNVGTWLKSRRTANTVEKTNVIQKPTCCLCDSGRSNQ